MFTSCFLSLQLMDATLCDTVGSQIINNKRNKGGSTASTLPGPLAKIAAKPQGPQPSAVVRPNGEFGEAAGQGGLSSTAAVTSMTTSTFSPTSAAELKPLIVLNSDIVTTSIHPATIVPSPSFISSPCFTETASASPSLGSTNNTDLSTSRFGGRKAPSFSPGVIPFQIGNTQSLPGLSSSFPSTSSCLTSLSTSLFAAAMSGGEARSQRGSEEQGGAALFQEVLKRQEEQAYLDRVARRRVEAREKRRERREVRMVESLGRIATALELLSSKQDTVIALLQRLADRK